ncbi:hypothetical protein [Acinetobacter haemolyticus]
MNNEFAWLKWVGLILVVSILGAVFYLIQNDKSKSPKADEVQQLANQKQYDEQLDQAAIATHDAQMEAQHAKENPQIYESLSQEQTAKFIARLEQLMAEDSKINLDHLPDVYAHSRKYNAQLAEAENIYGANDISNPYIYCISMVTYARELWSLKHTPTNMTEEYINKSQKRFFEAYEDAKKGCLEQVTESQN